MASEYVTSKRAAEILGVSVQRVSQSKNRGDAPDNLVDDEGLFNLDVLTNLINTDPAIARRKRLNAAIAAKRKESRDAGVPLKTRKKRKAKTMSSVKVDDSGEDSFEAEFNAYLLEFWKEDDHIADYMGLEGDTSWLKYFVSEALHFGFERSK